jgi:exopolysaccharide biosynthesis WecB/TagA/CpsF family protein
VTDPEHRYRLNHLDLITADGQPVRWALRLLHGVKLPDRVYGPELMQRLCAAAAREELPIFFYGSRADVLERLVANVQSLHPALSVAGAEPSKFRQVSPEEKREIAERIRSSGAAITFVGIGCPRQEIFAYEFRDLLSMPVIAVGAAFDYHAGLRAEPPRFIQRAGLQWLYRLIQEPRRLWKRYLFLNPAYVTLVALQASSIWRPDRRPNVALPSELSVA